jgi:hypothetical protein
MVGTDYFTKNRLLRRGLMFFFRLIIVILSTERRYYMWTAVCCIRVVDGGWRTFVGVIGRPNLPNQRRHGFFLWKKSNVLRWCCRDGKSALSAQPLCDFCDGAHWKLKLAAAEIRLSLVSSCHAKSLVSYMVDLSCSRLKTRSSPFSRTKCAICPYFLHPTH